MRKEADEKKRKEALIRSAKEMGNDAFFSSIKMQEQNDDVPCKYRNVGSMKISFHFIVMYLECAEGVSLYFVS